MANLRVDKITSTETFETTGSVHFDGVDDGLTVTDVAAFDLGTGDFTIEGWYYLKPGGGYKSLFDFRGSGADGIYPGLFKEDGADYIYYYVNSKRVVNNVNIDYNTWFHVAISRYSGTTKLFLNGKEEGFFADSNDYISRDILIGLSNSNTNDYLGFISNFRVVKGTALYTTDFKPPMRELEDIPGTVLLCCQSKTDTTHEKTGKTITANGNASACELTPGLLTPVPKAGAGSAITGSVEFDGAKANLEVTSSDFAMGDSDLTMECWFYNGVDTITHLLQIDVDGGATNFSLATRDAAAGDVRFLVRNDSSSNLSDLVGGAGGATINMWHHLAGTIEGTTTRLFLNGVLIKSGTISGTRTHTGDKVTIGSNEGNRYLKGYMSNVRIVRGTALYTADFIPPSRELKRVPGTVLLCCQDSNDPTQEVTGKDITLNLENINYDDVVSSGITTTPTPSNFTPQVGDDRKVTFEGVTKINSNAYFYLPTGNTESREATGNYNAGTRGIFGGSFTPVASQDMIEFINIATTGDSKDFGNLTQDRWGNGACASETRALWGAGLSSPSPSYYNIIDYVTIMSTGNALDFGDLTYGVPYYTAAVSNTVRGIWGGGYNTPSSPLVPSPFPTGFQTEMEYVTIASTGNGIDFGEFTARNSLSSFGSPTRGIFAGGATPTRINTMEYVNIASSGDAQDFGDLLNKLNYGAGLSNSIRGIVAGGYDGTADAPTNAITYTTIATMGGSVDFGDLVASRSELGGACSATRGVIGGGWSPAKVDEMDYITIATTGNAVAFGELQNTGVYMECGTSNGHGGLG